MGAESHTHTYTHTHTHTDEHRCVDNCVSLGDFGPAYMSVSAEARLHRGPTQRDKAVSV